MVASGADERRDRTGVGARHLGHDGVQVERLGLHPEATARDRRDHRNLVAGDQRLIALDVLAVAGIRDPRWLLAELQGRPDVGRNGPLGEVERTL